MEGIAEEDESQKVKMAKKCAHCDFLCEGPRRYCCVGCMDQKGHSEECKGIRAAAAALLNDSVEGIAEEDVAESELASEKERKARKERHKAATEPSSSSAPPNKKLKDQHVKKEILKKMEEERVRKKREKKGAPAFGEVSTIFLTSDGHEIPPPPDSPPPARSKRRRTSTCSSHESGVSLLTASLAATNRRCPGCRRVSCGTRVVCPGCRCVSCGTLACGCGPGCPLPGVDYAEVCRRRVDEQGDDYAPGIVLERGTRRALQTQQEDSDERAQCERAQDFADIARERAQFVEDIVRERKALQSQREQEEAEEAEEAEVQAFLRSDAHDEADWAARPACDIDGESLDEDESLDDESLDEDFLRKARALQFKREQEQNEADRSSIDGGAASSSMEQPPLPHMSARGPLKATTKMRPLQPMPKRVVAAMPKTVVAVKKPAIKKPITVTTRDKHCLRPSLQARPSQQALVTGAALPPPEKTSGESTAIIKEEEEEEGIAQDAQEEGIAQDAQEGIAQEEDPTPWGQDAGIDARRFSIDEALANVDAARAAVRDIQQNPAAYRPRDMKKAMEKLQRWSQWAAGYRPKNLATRNAHRQRNRDKQPKVVSPAVKGIAPPAKVAGGIAQSCPKVVPPPPKVVPPPAKGIAPPAKGAEGIAPLSTKSIAPSPPSSTTIARVPPRPLPPPKSIAPRPPIHIPFAYKGAEPARAAPPVQQFLKAWDEHISIEKCGNCGKIRQFNPAENYPQWIIDNASGYYCSEECRIDGEAAAAQAAAEGPALG